MDSTSTSTHILKHSEITHSTDSEHQNRATADALYKSLAAGRTDAVAKFLATDLEWWFHGPPHCQYMMRVLTGESSHAEFRFEPRSITAIGDSVIVAEGWEGAQVYWVHVWTLKDGVITQFREYFNTWLVVADLRQPAWEEVRHDGLTVWQSHPRDLFHRSLPAIMLAL
ncbi:wound-induced protein 1 [Cucurbita maxima]|uniref:Wound-induced protein 1 n=1 Tax=Cucurbita maxima TaxID=3661 RepID=A0A6J1IMA8_CUCMA|nr:wound-induced protein 1 [Cucurbita maxima]